MRGIAAAAIKKRAGVAAVKARERKFVADKQNPFRPFASLDRQDMYDAMTDFIQKMDPVNQREVIRIFNILLTGVPWPLTQSFFVEFDESDYPNIVSFFKKFMQEPRVVEGVAKMKELIRRRQAQPLTSEGRKPGTGGQQIEEREPRRVIKISQAVPSGRPSVVQRAARGRMSQEEVDERVKPMFGDGRILSKCEREYGRAPWMTQFTDKPIRGFVIRSRGVSQFTSSFYRNGEGWGDDDWYRVNMRWMKEACEGKRMFQEDAVAMITVDDELIVETRDMFDAAQGKWTKVVDNEFAPVSEKSFSVAKEMLEDSILPSGDVNAVLASLVPLSGDATNHDMARRLSWVLVFLKRLIKDPQVHHFRVKNHQIPPDTLVELDRYTLLPEVYKNPDGDHDEAEIILKKKRREIESIFFSNLKPSDPTRRKQMSPVRPEVFRPLQTNARAKCPTGVDDVIYYDENGELFCFGREQVVGVVKNPITGKPFRQTFLDEIAMIKDVRIRSTREQEQEVVIERQVERELAPGLFQKLKDEINLIRTLFCNQCDAEIFLPRFKSVKGNEKVMFCSQQCFDQFDF